MRDENLFKKMLASLQDKPLAIILFFFAISVAIRLPNLDRPLSKHHELNAALVLINAEEWNRKTPAFYNYVPVHSYHEPGDDVYNQSNKEGRDYLVNVSFGSLWYIMPFGFFRVLQAEPSPLLLQVFNLLLHLISVLLIYKLALYLFKKESEAEQKALLTSIVYLFCPSPLWFHGNGYVHEVAVLPFVFGATLLYLQTSHGRVSAIKYLVLSLTIVAGICCDWLMCFVAAAMFVCTLISYTRRRWMSDLIVVIVLVLGAVVGVLITVWQFSSFMGFESYIQSLVSRFFVRGVKGNAEGVGLSKGKGILSFYLLGYGLFIPLILVAFLLVKQFKQQIQRNSRLKNFILVGGIVCLFHHLLFWGFTNIHDYSVVKSGLVISLLSAIAIYSLRDQKKRIVALALVLLVNTGVYYYINVPGKYAANGQPYTYFKELGEKMTTIATPDDYIFIDTPEMSLILTYYSKRYYRNVRDADEAETFFRELPGKKALFIHTNNFEFVSYKRLKK
jgi:hypothetical protein